MSSRTASPSRVRAVTAGVVVVLALLPWLDVATAHAATLEGAQGAGLTEAGGLAETPDGGIWASDAARLERPTVLFGAGGGAR